MELLVSLYIAATVFGVGVTFVDMIGLLGGEQGAEGSDDGASDASGAGFGGADSAGTGTFESGDAGADDTGGADAGGYSAVDAGTDADTSAVDSADVDQADLADVADADSGDLPAEADQPESVSPVDSRTSLAGHDRPESVNPILRILSALRNLVYFSLGFGPVGLFSLIRTGNFTESLLWSVPVGLVVMWGTRRLRRFMQKDLDSQIRDAELLMEKAEVTVGIRAGQFGRIRVHLGSIFTDRYARAKDPTAVMEPGSTVRIVDIADDIIYVEKE